MIWPVFELATSSASAAIRRMSRAAAHARDQPPMNLADQSLGDRPAVVQVFTDEFKRVTIVQKLPRVVRIGLRHRLSREQSLRLLQVSCVPSICVVWCASKSSARERIVASQSSESFVVSRSPRRSIRVNCSRHVVADAKRRPRPAGDSSSVTAIPPGTRTRPVRRSFMTSY